jgi:hypothetical protein
LEDLRGAVAVLQAYLMCAPGAVGAVVEVDEEVAVDLHPSVGVAVDPQEPGAQLRIELGCPRYVGFVLVALVAGVAADVASSETAILIVTALTAASGMAVLGTRWPARPTLRPTGEAAARALGVADVPQREPI